MNTGTGSTITLGNGSAAGNGNVGISATNTGAAAGNIAATAGINSTITVGTNGGQNDATRGILASTAGTGTVAVTTNNGSTITVNDNSPGANTDSNAIRAASTSGAITINVGVNPGDTSVLQSNGTGGGPVVRADTTNGGNITIATQSGARLDSAGAQGEGIQAQLSGVGTGAINVTNNGIIGTSTAVRVGTIGIVANQISAVGQTGGISVTNTVSGQIFAGTDGIVAGSSTALATTATTGGVTVSNAGLVNANQRGVFESSPGLGTAASPVVVQLTNTGTILGGQTATVGTTNFSAIDVRNGNTAVPTVPTVIGATAVQTLITNAGNGTTTGIIQGAGLGDLGSCPLTGTSTATAGCNPVVSVQTASGAILNNNGGLITDLNNNAASRANLALYFASTPGASTNTINNTGTITGRAQLSSSIDTFNNNAGGVWNLMDGTNGVGAAGQAAANFGDATAANNTLNNAGTINANGTANVASFINLQAFNNNLGGIFNAGNQATSVTQVSSDGTVTGPSASVVQVATQAGTSNVSGALRYLGAAGSSFTNAATSVNSMQTPGNATTDRLSFNVNITGGGATQLSNSYVPGAAYNWLGGGRLKTDTFLGERTNSRAFGVSGTDVPSDRLLISGTAPTLPSQSALATGVIVNNTNPTFASYNPLGITVVGVNASSTNAFRLAGLTCGSSITTDFCASAGAQLQANLGPMGAIKSGWWSYYLLQSTAPETKADGLTGAAASEYRLYGLPGPEALSLPYAISGAQNMWFETTTDWLDRQDDLHRWWRRSARAAGSAAGGGADVPATAGQSGYVSNGGPGFWMKVSGAWADRTSSFNLGTLVPAAAVLPAQNLSFKQNTYAVMAGYDTGAGGLLSPADGFVVGVMGGYNQSTLSFKAFPASFNYTGGSVGLSATYINYGWFADSLLKADLLRLTMSFGDLTKFGFAETPVNVWNLGYLGNLGYRYQLGSAYIEPAATLAYVRTAIDNFTALGMTTKFSDGEALRGALGARLGAAVFEDETHVVDASIQARYWDAFSSVAGVTLGTAGPALLENDNLQTKSYVEVRGLWDVALKGSSGFSGFVDAGAKFNNQSTIISTKGGLRYQW